MVASSTRRALFYFNCILRWFMGVSAIRRYSTIIAVSMTSAATFAVRRLTLSPTIGSSADRRIRSPRADYCSATGGSPFLLPPAPTRAPLRGALASCKTDMLVDRSSRRARPEKLLGELSGGNGDRRAQACSDDVCQGKLVSRKWYSHAAPRPSFEGQLTKRRCGNRR